MEHHAHHVAREGPLDLRATDPRLLAVGSLVGQLAVEGRFELGPVMLHALVPRASLEQVLDSEEDLGPIDRLGEEVFGSRGEREFHRVRRTVRRQDQDRHEAL
ncbi:MAG TPA: hypothetical protein VGN51_14890, partial [Acidimicrobiia bacterium]